MMHAYTVLSNTRTRQKDAIIIDRFYVRVSPPSSSLVFLVHTRDSKSKTVKRYMRFVVVGVVSRSASVVLLSDQIETSSVHAQ